MAARYRNILTSLIVTASAILVTLSLIEIGLRIAGWQRFFETVERSRAGTERRLDIRTLTAEAEIRHVTREFDVTYTTNSLGYFDREWDIEKEPGTLRIGFFGDSFTMGHGVGLAKAFPRLAAPLIAERLDGPVEILNFGIWGSGTLDEREYIEDAAGLGLDHVVLCFYINDIFDNERYLSEKVARDHGTVEDGEKASHEKGSFGTEVSMVDRLKSFLNRHVRVFAFAMERSKNLRDALGLVTYPLEKVFTGGENGAIERAAGYIRDIDALLDARGIALTVVYIPSRIQTGTVRVPDDFDLDLPNSVLGTELGDIDFLDLTPSFRRDDGGDYYYREGHLDEDGHRLVAELIASRLEIDLGGK